MEGEERGGCGRGGGQGAYGPVDEGAIWGIGGRRVEEEEEEEEEEDLRGDINLSSKTNL